MPNRLRDLVIDRVDLVDKGANQEAHVVIVKRDIRKDGPTATQTHVNTPDWMVAEKSVLSSAARHDLPDSAFAAVWTDGEGKTQRALPYKHADGTVDKAHLDNALARLDQTALPDTVKAEARHKLEAATKEQGVNKKEILKRLADLFKGDDGDDDLSKAAMAPEQLADMKAHHDGLGQAISAYGDASKLPAEHPVHKLMALHKDLGAKLAAYGTQPGDGGLESFNSVPMVNKREEFTKAVDDAVKKATADLVKRTAEAETIAKTERDARLVEKKAGELRKLSSLSIDIEKDAPLFKKLEDAAPDAYKRVTEILAGADAMAKTAAVLERELGSPLGGDAASTAWKEIEAEADKLMAKDAGGKLSKAKAIDVVMKKRTDLVKRYYAEKGEGAAQ